MATIYGVPSRLIGNVGVDTNSPVTAFHVSTSLTSFPRGIMSGQYGTDANGALFISRKARGNQDGPSTVAASDVLGEWSVEGYDSANYLRVGKIRFEVPSTATVAATRVGTQIVFSTATDASPSVLTDRMWVMPDGKVGIGIAPSGSTLEVQGTASISSTLAANRFNPIVGALTSGSGLYLPSSGNLSLSINSADIVRVVSTGVGIGTTVPGAFGLAINHATGSCLDLIYNDSDGSPANHATLTVSSAGTLFINSSSGITDINQTVGFRSTAGTLLGRLFASSDGIFKLTTAAETGFGRLGFGPLTSSFSSIKANGTSLNIRLADDSGDAGITASTAIFSSSVTQGAAAAGVTSTTRLIKAVSSIADAVATDILTVTIPNAAHSAKIRVEVTGSLGAGGAIGANEASASNTYDFTLCRTAGVATVVGASSAFGASSASVAGAATVTCTLAATAMTGAVGATQTFTIQATITRSGGSSTNHTALVVATINNENATGVSIS